MYLPYLRGKGEEVRAVQAVAARIAGKRKVRPLFEPAAKNARPLLAAALQLEGSGVPYVIIENPSVGDWAARHAEVRRDIVAPACGYGPACRPALVIRAGVTPAQVRAFLRHYAGRPTVLVHVTSYQAGAQLRNVIAAAPNVEHQLFLEPAVGAGYRVAVGGADSGILEDKFARRANNAAYAARADELFTTEHTAHVLAGRACFSDFTVVGNHYRVKGGFGALAVALHLTYARPNGEVWVRHFVSHRTPTVVNTEAKTLEVLDAAVQFANSIAPALNFSSVIPEWRAALATTTAPSLGWLKRQTIRHHLELMDSLL